MIWQLSVFQTTIWEQILFLYLYKYCDPHWCHNCHRIEQTRYVVITARNPPNIQTWCRSQWPRVLRRRSTAARLLRLWVRIPLGAWMSVCCECCVLSGRGLCDALIMRPEESYRLWCVVACDLETSRMRRPWPALGRSVKGKKNKDLIWRLTFAILPVPCLLKPLLTVPASPEHFRLCFLQT